MNTIKILKLMLTITLLVSCGSDDNDNSTQNPVNQLPEATQTGENTFGCILDGEAFIPSGGNNPLDCVYQLINGERFFYLQGNNKDEDFNRTRISLYKC